MIPYLTLNGVSYRYPGKRNPESVSFALEDVSLQIQKGEAFGLLGSNGSGKSTLLKIISSLLKPTTGAVLFNGKSIDSCLSEYRTILNYSTGGSLGFYPRLNAIENMQFLSGLKGQMLEPAQIERLLARTELGTSAYRKKYFTYSLGMRQRMHIAKLLLEPNEIILMDEPTNGLDPAGMERLVEILNQDLKHKTKVIISHDSEFLKRTTQRQSELKSGKLVYN